MKSSTKFSWAREIWLSRWNFPKMNISPSQISWLPLCKHTWTFQYPRKTTFFHYAEKNLEVVFIVYIVFISRIPYHTIPYHTQGMKGSNHVIVRVAARVLFPHSACIFQKNSLIAFTHERKAGNKRPSPGLTSLNGSNWKMQQLAQCFHLFCNCLSQFHAKISCWISSCEFWGTKLHSYEG